MSKGLQRLVPLLQTQDGQPSTELSLIANFEFARAQPCIDDRRAEHARKAANGDHGPLLGRRMQNRFTNSPAPASRKRGNRPECSKGEVPQFGTERPSKRTTVTFDLQAFDVTAVIANPFLPNYLNRNIS
jgi:hypothetical protein